MHQGANPKLSHLQQNRMPIEVLSPILLDTGFECLAVIQSTNSNAGWLVPAATLTAAIVGLLAASIAAWVSANASSLIAERRRIEEKYDGALRQLGRVQASRVAMTIEGHPDLTEPELEAARATSIEDFFRSYRHETFELRAILSELRQEGVIGRISSQNEARIAEQDIPLIRAQLMSNRAQDLQSLSRKWLPLASRSAAPKPLEVHHQS